MTRDPHPFLVPPDSFSSDGRVHFPAEEAHHARRVVRLAAGDECRVVDGHGGLYRVRLSEESGALIGSILEEQRVERLTPMIRLGFPALRQRARVEWLIEKAVEVGVAGLVPIAWERSVKGVSGEQRRRWERIVREAMKQSEGRWLPELEAERIPGEDVREDAIVLADPEGTEDLPAVAGRPSVLLLIGPEGGVTDGEKRKLIDRGCALWSLGPTRLRAETAAIVASHRLGCGIRAARA